jgi:hypothetical protein
MMMSFIICTLSPNIKAIKSENEMGGAFRLQAEVRNVYILVRKPEEKIQLGIYCYYL